MRVLIGVEQSEGAQEVSEWAHAFGFPSLVEEWMHVVPSQGAGVWALDPFLAANQSERLQEQAASKIEQALLEKSQGVSVRVRIGNPARELLHRADTTPTELVAVRGSNKNLLSEFLLGSVARALVEGASQSVLLTRGSAPQGKLRVVVATDHSEYMERALEKLVAWAPQGVGRLTLLHVLPAPYKAEMDQFAQEIAHEAYGRPIRTPEEVSDAAAKALGAKLGLPAEAIHSVVAHGSVSQAIETTLDASDADLLILGAKGHSFLERLTLGSVSFRAVTTCRKSILVLRG
jgi:nucleotide-binding universal stress UspA family protein